MRRGARGGRCLVPSCVWATPASVLMDTSPWQHVGFASSSRPSAPWGLNSHWLLPASCDSSCPFSSCQQLLPATGVPVTRHQFDHMTDMFDEYVKSRTLQNWKFWIVSLDFLCPTPSQTSTPEQQTHTLVPLERFCK